MITWVSHTDLINESGVSRNTFNKLWLDWILANFPPQKVVGDRKSWTKDTADKIMDGIRNGLASAEKQVA